MPWNLYSFPFLVVIAGLTHVPHVYLYVAAALRGLGSDARGSGPQRRRESLAGRPRREPADGDCRRSCLPACWCSFSASSCSACRWCSAIRRACSSSRPISTSSPTSSAVPSYQLMAVVVVIIVAITLPLVFMLRPAPERGAAPCLGSQQGPARRPAQARALALAGVPRDRALVDRDRAGAAGRNHAAVIRRNRGAALRCRRCSRSTIIARCSNIRT